MRALTIVRDIAGQDLELVHPSLQVQLHSHHWSGEAQQAGGARDTEHQLVQTQTFLLVKPCIIQGHLYHLGMVSTVHFSKVKLIN